MEQALVMASLCSRLKALYWAGEGVAEKASEDQLHISLPDLVPFMSHGLQHHHLENTCYLG